MLASIRADEDFEANGFHQVAREAKAEEREEEEDEDDDGAPEEVSKEQGAALAQEREEAAVDKAAEKPKYVL